jgi:hypothetical protein
VQLELEIATRTFAEFPLEEGTLELTSYNKARPPVKVSNSGFAIIKFTLLKFVVSYDSQVPAFHLCPRTATRDFNVPG